MQRQAAADSRAGKTARTAADGAVRDVGECSQVTHDEY